MSVNVQTEGKTAATWSRGISRSPSIALTAGFAELQHRPRDLKGVDMVVGWGNKVNTQKPFAIANQAGVQTLRLEDGFLRSYLPGVSGAPPLSIVADDLGIYYDATKASRLEQIIQFSSDDVHDLEYTNRLIKRFVSERLSKYNHGLDQFEFNNDRPTVLVVDQTLGDLSITDGLASETSFQHMLEAARDENPDANILIKTHPDVLLGKRQGHYSNLSDDARVQWLTTPVTPAVLFQHIEKLYVVTSQLGFEGLLHNLPVRCFGMPWYAGWGLTNDELNCERRTKTVSLQHLFSSAFLHYSKYLCPYSHQSGNIESVMDWIAGQKANLPQQPANTLCIGFRAWKRGHLKRFVGSAHGNFSVRRSAKNLQEGHIDKFDRVVVWGSRQLPALERHCRAKNKPWIRMEDGFLRSVGLGSDFVRPASLVLDERGIYYDPRQPSQLENLLNTHDVDTATLDRAKQLLEYIKKTGLSKYNVGQRSIEIKAPAGKTKILVVGQVEDDASVHLGCPGIRTNLALLERARSENPNAWLVYKPHPDVVAGNRKGKVKRRELKRICDQVLADADIHSCISQVDSLQVLTSLAGFEALLQDKQVVVHGQPFYSGWGLTQDYCPVTRRTRQRSLIELVAITLILYPKYYDWVLGGFTSVESIMMQLEKQRNQHAGQPITGGRLNRYGNKLQNLAEGLRRH